MSIIEKLNHFLKSRHPKDSKMVRQVYISPKTCPEFLWKIEIFFHEITIFCKIFCQNLIFTSVGKKKSDSKV